MQDPGERRRTTRDGPRDSRCNSKRHDPAMSRSVLCQSRASMIGEPPKPNGQMPVHSTHVPTPTQPEYWSGQSRQSARNRTCPLNTSHSACARLSSPFQAVQLNDAMTWNSLPDWSEETDPELSVIEDPSGDRTVGVRDTGLSARSGDGTKSTNKTTRTIPTMLVCLCMPPLSGFANRSYTYTVLIGRTFCKLEGVRHQSLRNGRLLARDRSIKPIPPEGHDGRSPANCRLGVPAPVRGS